MHQEVIMSECGQAYPEYIAPRERNNRVKVMGVLRTTKLHSDFILATDCQMWTLDGENATQPAIVEQGQQRTGLCIQGN